MQPATPPLLAVRSHKGCGIKLCLQDTKHQSSGSTRSLSFSRSCEALFPTKFPDCVQKFITRWL
eukprot:6228952-Amphidinium_carterae.1